MTKKIVISANKSWNVYNFRYSLIKELINKNYNVVVVAPYDRYSEKLKNIGCKTINIYISSKSTNPIEDLRTLFQYWKIYKKEKPDLVVNFTIKPVIYGSIVCSLLKIKTVNTITGLGTGIIKNNLTTKIIKLLYKISQRKVNKLIFQNEYDYEYFIRENLINNIDTEIVAGSGVDTEKFKPVKIEKKDNKFRFLLIARMLWDKGIGEYVEAAKLLRRKYKNLEFLLIGEVGVDNPSAIPKEKILEWERDGIIKYLGTTDNIREEIAKADCIVLPSYREGTSRVLLEGLSMEKPVIATDVPGCNNIVEDGLNGFLCKVRDPQDLADKMEKILKLSDREREIMGKRGREKVLKEFDQKIVVKRYIKIIEEIIKE